MVPASIFGQQQGLGVQAHGTLVPPNDTKFLIVLVELELARDARVDNLNFNIYDELACEAIAYLYLCTSNRAHATQAQFQFRTLPECMRNTRW
jgi:hypothetical protein